LQVPAVIEAHLADLSSSYSYEPFKKTELELALDEHLAENTTQFQSDPKLQGYYSSRARAIGSPVKKDFTERAVDTIRLAKRKATKALEDLTPT
jgi:hypothetical protein